MSSAPYIFSLPIDELTLKFKASDIPITIDDNTRQFFILFIDKTNNTFNDIREFYLAEKKSNMAVWCCLLGCTIVGMIPCCIWINQNSKKNKEMNIRLEMILNQCVTDLIITLKDFNGLALVKKQIRENAKNDENNWAYFFEIKCDSLEHSSVPDQGLQGNTNTSLNANKINAEIDMNVIDNKDMIGQEQGYSSGVTNCDQPYYSSGNYPFSNQIVPNKSMDAPPQIQ